MRGNVLVRCGGRWTETYCRNAARRCPSTPILDTVPGDRCNSPSGASPKVIACATRARLSITFDVFRADDVLWDLWQSGKAQQVRSRLAANFIGWADDAATFDTP
jgi:hypothetical protein